MKPKCVIVPIDAEKACNTLKVDVGNISVFSDGIHTRIHINGKPAHDVLGCFVTAFSFDADIDGQPVVKMKLMPIMSDTGFDAVPNVATHQVLNNGK